MGYWETRKDFLTPPLASRELRLRDVRRAAERLSGDPNDLRLFGMSTLVWYMLGVRILGRTAIEATRDPQARFVGWAVAETLRQHDYKIQTVIDPFAGSGNSLYHLMKATSAPLGIGIEADAEIYRRTKSNFDVLQRWKRLRGSHVDIRHGDWSDYRSFLGDQATLMHLDPPWGDAFNRDGLDLRVTHPPILHILSDIARSKGPAPVFVAISTMPQVVQESVEEIRANHRTFATRKSASPPIAARADYLLVRVHPGGETPE